MRKQIQEIFKQHDLQTTAEAINCKIVNFLDVTFNLEDESFKPYCKPNNVPQYVHRMSNHPPTVLKNLPKNVNHRLSSISSNEELFNNAVPQYQEAIKNSGYDFILKFEPTASNPKPKNRNRKRNILWFNPPWNSEVETNVGKEFLKLIDECFPPENPLSKIFNRRSVKVSYSTTPSIEQIIAGKNAKVLKEQPSETPQKTCSCPSTKECLLDQKCLEKNIIYQATVEQPNKEPKTYVGLTATTFKARFGVHKKSFEDPEYVPTTLSNYIHDLKSKGIETNVTWKILDRATSYSPVTDVCHLCNKEAYYIIFEPHLAQLNSRSELFSTCMHKKSNLLFKPKRGRPRKSPGT